MNKKDLAEEYALEEYASVNGENDLIFEDNRCFTFEDLKAAFNAGCESVVGCIINLLAMEITCQRQVRFT